MNVFFVLPVGIYNKWRSNKETKAYLYVEAILGSSKTVRLLFQLLTRLNAPGTEGTHVTSETAACVRHTDLKPQFTSTIETDRMPVNEMQANDIHFLHLHSSRTVRLATGRVYNHANKFETSLSNTQLKEK
jgi:hypothetical protein